jgi:ribosome-binding factor A
VSRGKPGARRDRVAEAIKSELSALIQREIKDPRVAAAFPAIGSVVSQSSSPVRLSKARNLRS